MSNDTRTLCQLPVGTKVMSRTGLRFTIQEIHWEQKIVEILYTDNKLDVVSLEAPVYYDDQRQTWRMGREN